ncbi:MAG: hypothetical protein U9Q33_10175 [Campylobacterota bacterium]|nr:hypothetical protein [Campylobacterota bacterium]
MDSKYKYFFVYFIITLFTVGTFWYQKEYKIDKHLDIEFNNVMKNYNIIYSQYKDTANIIFKTKINKSEIIKIFKNGNSADKTLQDKARKGSV